MMDGLIVGIDLLMRHCGTKKYKKRVFLITDGEKATNYSAQELKSIINNMNQSDTRLNVITLDFCNELAEDEDEEEENNE
jgi:Ku70/Ku80 N-terminal alpha/beta domain